MKIAKVGVVGLGAMGAGIAQSFLQAGYTVHVTDVMPKQVEAGLKRISQALQKLVDHEQLPGNELTPLMGRLTSGTDLQGHRTCDLVIEAVIECLAEKQKVFQLLDTECEEKTILASNTSTLPVALLAAATKRPAKVLGLHFFNPAAVMKLVEVTRTLVTSEETLESAVELVKSIQKTPVLAKDKAGFIVNRLLTPYLFDAMRALDEGLASVEDIDNSMVLGCGHPMGPLKLADFIGLDVLGQGAASLFDEYKDARFAAPIILKRLVSMGFVGVKSGKGFYDWSNRKNPLPNKF